MRRVRLLVPHEEHKDGKMVRHPAGATVDLPDAVADYIAMAIVQSRMALREKAAAFPGSPESRR
jgi:hypothetical protein